MKTPDKENVPPPVHRPKLLVTPFPRGASEKPVLYPFTPTPLILSRIYLLFQTSGRWGPPPALGPPPLSLSLWA
jgi:hypothetical protein